MYNDTNVRAHKPRQAEHMELELSVAMAKKGRTRTTCPLCQGQHNLSQCARWLIPPEQRHEDQR